MYPAPSDRLPSWPRRRFCKLCAQALLSASVAAGASSCGTLLYPERRGQPRGQLDMGVIALDAIGLIFFIVPGLIAFCVDFATGAIYLPPPAYVPTSAGRGRRPELRRVDVAGEQLTQARVEETVRQHTGKLVDLGPGRFHASPMNDLAEFEEAAERLSDPGRSGPPACVRSWSSGLSLPG